MNKASLIFALFITVGVINNVHGQQSTFLKKLEGTWYAKGTSFGLPSDVDMVWVTVLGGKYTQLQYKITMHGKDGKDQLFEGTAYYKPTSVNEYKANWFDSGGDMHPISATHDDTTLTSTWGTTETKMGKTTYKLLDEKTIEVTDFIQKKDGSWQQFGKNTLTRKL
jgi:hypothetical protein